MARLYTGRKVCRLSETYKICPICDTPNHRNANVCSTCGTTLSDVETKGAWPAIKKAKSPYDFRYGETDLDESHLQSVGNRYTILLASLALFIGIALGAILFRPQFGATPDTTNAEPVIIINPNPNVTLAIATVTPGPPTATLTSTPTITLTPSATFTPTPCLERVLEGDSLIAIAIRCGHLSQDIIPIIVELNGLPNASSIRIGDIIEVPWPTPTPDPNALPTDTPEGESSSTENTIEIAGVVLEQSAIDPFAPTATATLLPGVTWHEVRAGENIIIIADTYGANVKVLSELNPEVDFARCEFGETYGGPDCIVQLFEGQRLRVPAPTPTPTIQPTLSGSETPTPTATPTFNAPSLISPTERQSFRANELVTLRWIPTGTLNDNEVYRITVKDVTSNLEFTADTKELFYILPIDWQGQDGKRHEYQWTVSVINLSAPDSPIYVTDTSTFVWQAREASN